MKEMVKAKQPFRFYTRLQLSELTGLKAANLTQLLNLLKEVSGSSIYHHTHRFLQQHQYLSPEPPNDFAYWITEILGENELAERLASIDIVQFPHIRNLREKIIKTIKDYLKENPSAKSKIAKKDEEFHFIRSVSFILPTNYIATDLREFSDILKKITTDSIYFHVFEARLRLEKETNDFSLWIENSIQNKKLADEIARLDPYTRTLEDLRNVIVNMAESAIH
ncbi:hypothetical protein KAS42_04320 [bacterium]|nr:hypothetical protein [bacterium]